MFRYSLVLFLLLVPTPVLAAETLATLTAAFLALSPVTQAVIQLGASLLLSLAAQALLPKPRTPQQKRELNVPNSRPPKRFVYGRNRTYGSPAPWRVKGRVLYGCLILNSRRSAGTNLRIFMDKREATITSGDVFDFSGPGALLGDIESFAPFTDNPTQDTPRVWIGLGGQSGPPQVILDEAPEFFEATDRWRGATVMWVRLYSGGGERFADRWRAVPPEFEVEMDWSFVWDPRDSAQDPDDPLTWQFSRNQALALLDALRTNPARRYKLNQIHLPSFIEGADVADQATPRKDDSDEPRYEANGIVIWSGAEIEDQVTPIAEAGAGEIVRIGGRLGYASGVYRPPMFTLRDIVADGGIEYQVLRPGRDLPRFVKAAYIAPDRDWQEAELEPVAVAGATTGAGDEAVAEVTLPFVTSPTQAMRIQQILARRFERQKTLSVTAFPDAMDVVAGATIEVDMPGGYSRLNGEWTVTSANPALWINEQADDEGGGHVRVPLTLRQNDEQIYEWNPETDQQDIVEEDFDPEIPDLEPPTDLLATFSNNTIVFRFTAPGAPDFIASRAQWQWRLAGEDWVVGGFIGTEEANPSTGFMFALLSPASPGVSYEFRARMEQEFKSGSRVSDWAELTEPFLVALLPPADGQATGGAGEIEVSFRLRNAPAIAGADIWMSETPTFDDGDLLETVFGGPNSVVSATVTGLPPSTTRYFWARTITAQGGVSPWTAAPVSATTDP